MKSLVIGNGQIGSSVAEVISVTDDVTIYDKSGSEPPILKSVEILHICFPYSKQFIKQVNQYIIKYQPWHVIIWSTVTIGTTRKIRGAVHSPVEGRHPHLASSIKQSVRWIGANNPAEEEFFTGYFRKLLIKTKILNDSNFTEFLKLRSTSKYGINLMWTDYEARVADEIGMDFDYLKDFDEDYNKLYHNLGMDWARRYILNPPKGKIGGHCVVPNAELLDQQFPDELLKMIKEYK